MMTAVLFASFILLLTLNVPISFSLLISSLIALAYKGIPLMVMIQRVVTAADSFILIAIPFFMLAGNLMSGGGISRTLTGWANAVVGFVRGGLAHVTVLSSMIISGITGSSVADASAIGTIMIPAMLKEGYRKDFATGLVASATTVGVIIPPSIPFVIYGVITGASIGKLFMGGMVPGVLFSIFAMIISFFICRKQGVGAPKRFSWRELFQRTREGIWALLAPVVILGGIIFGVFTPTEAAAVGVLYALFVGFVIHKELKIKDMPQIILESAGTTAIVMLMVVGAFLYSWIITVDQVPQMVARFILGISRDPVIVLFMFVGLFIVAGMFIDLGANIVLLIPVLFPVTQELRIDPVFFGVVTVVALAVGLVTPPVGASLFITCDISKTPLIAAFRASLPYLGGVLLTLVLMILFPGIVMYFPDLMVR
jgi:C4-dicarboxylate transporter, DctM subunit